MSHLPKDDVGFSHAIDDVLQVILRARDDGSSIDPHAEAVRMPHRGGRSHAEMSDEIAKLAIAHGVTIAFGVGLSEPA
jgi:hypothetical protein